MIYILGIMLYKFGLEAFNGSIVALATNRYDREADLNPDSSRNTFEVRHRSSPFGMKLMVMQRVGLLVGLNQAFQCVGSILIAPLIKRFPTKNVLSTAIVVFGLFTAILLIVDAATGGYIKPRDWADPKDWSYYGNWNTGASQCP